jgi:hypothetical protein
MRPPARTDTTTTAIIIGKFMMPDFMAEAPLMA